MENILSLMVKLKSATTRKTAREKKKKKPLPSRLFEWIERSCSNSYDAYLVVLGTYSVEIEKSEGP